MATTMYQHHPFPQTYLELLFALMPPPIFGGGAASSRDAIPSSFYNAVAAAANGPGSSGEQSALAFGSNGQGLLQQQNPEQTLSPLELLSEIAAIAPTLPSTQQQNMMPSQQHHPFPQLDLEPLFVLIPPPTS